ncbi:MAG: hypothetical protein OXM88_07995 [bacterium]|nr:hypothetical protein [bacterium]
MARALLRDFLYLIEHEPWQANQYPHMKKAARRVGQLLGRRWFLGILGT